MLFIFGEWCEALEGLFFSLLRWALSLREMAISDAICYMQNSRSQQFQNVFETFPSDFLELAKWALVLVKPKMGQKGWRSWMYCVKSLLDTNLISLYLFLGTGNSQIFP